jgi:hypothetical protein
MPGRCRVDERAGVVEEIEAEVEQAGDGVAAERGVLRRGASRWPDDERGGRWRLDLPSGEV